jgi:ABC-type transport system involved in multi-copper enzyme maturation permease subunit
VNAATVIERELRAESRRPANHWLRVLAAGVLLVVFANLVLDARVVFFAEVGGAIFRSLHWTLLLAFWIIVPLMTADCISREKREGTLGLLFLTPLTVSDIIAGKAVIHVLRALTLFLAAVPILGLPIVFGGVAWTEVVADIFAQANAVCLGIAAGIYASTGGGTTVQTMVMAVCYSLGIEICCGICFGLLNAIVSPPPISLPIALLTGISWLAAAVALILKLSARKLRQSWQEQTAAPERPLWVEGFSSAPEVRAIFAWNKNRTLDKNPIAWLQEYSWTARLTKWGWFLVVLVAELIVLGSWEPRRAPESRWFLPAGLALAVAFSAVGSFRRKNETGLLELLLVTPLSVRQLVCGRIWGIFCHYFPAVSIFLVLVWGDYLLNPRAYPTSHLAGTFLLSLFSMTIVGLCLSLSRLNFFLAWLLTWAIAFLVPLSVTIALLSWDGLPQAAVVGLPWVFQIAIASFALFLLERKLRLRTFVTRKEQKLDL